jgi:hypothetical protein
MEKIFKFITYSLHIKYTICSQTGHLAQAGLSGAPIPNKYLKSCHLRHYVIIFALIINFIENVTSENRSPVLFRYHSEIFIYLAQVWTIPKFSRKRIKDFIKKKVIYLHLYLEHKQICIEKWNCTQDTNCHSPTKKRFFFSEC